MGQPNKTQSTSGCALFSGALDKDGSGVYSKLAVTGERRHLVDKAAVRVRAGKALTAVAGIALAAGLAGCFRSGATGPASERPAVNGREESVAARADDALFQYSLITALAAGDYDGGLPLRELLQHGDFGIGTFDRLDGELILLDGQVFQAMADGTIRRADLSGGSPFVSATFFGEDGQLSNLSAASLDDLDQQLDRKLPRRNSPYALRMEVELSDLTLRSVPPQKPPYRPLVDVVRDQSTWSRQNVRGTLVGLRCPAWIGTLNVAGYHWHFLSDDHTIGGHVLDCRFNDAVLRYDECTSLVVQIPTSDAFESFDASNVADKDIDKIERQRTSEE